MIQHPFRDTFLSKHHIINKIRGGKTRPNNILMLWRDKHSAFHFLFSDLSLSQILQRWNFYEKYVNTYQWKLVFNSKDFNYCKDVLKRVNRIKKKQPKHY